MIFSSDFFVNFDNNVVPVSSLGNNSSLLSSIFTFSKFPQIAIIVKLNCWSLMLKSYSKVIYSKLFNINELLFYIFNEYTWEIWTKLNFVDIILKQHPDLNIKTLLWKRAPISYIIKNQVIILNS